ncbi:MAG: hypothetical protein KDA68_01535 [Planctomycetaceae bacterium]|nr:hypothetical protein [Planctomycetaceae bacterium]
MKKTAKSQKKARKSEPKKAASKKSGAKKTTLKKAAPKKGVAKKTVAKKSVAKKTASKVTKKSAPKKAAPKKAPPKKVEAKKPELKKNEFTEFRVLLEVIRGRLRGDVTQLTNEALGTDRGDMGSESKSPTHMAELGSETFEQDFALSLVENEQETLSEIDAALVRIKDGSYGQCEACLADGKTATQAMIPKTRLRAIPYARNCVSCTRKKESY